MIPRRLTTSAARSAVGTLARGATVATGVVARAKAQPRNIDPAARQLLRRATEYVGSLGQFSAEARTHREDLLPSGCDKKTVGGVDDASVVRPAIAPPSPGDRLVCVTTAPPA